jgi:hypothetical protein
MRRMVKVSDDERLAPKGSREINNNDQSVEISTAGLVVMDNKRKGCVPVGYTRVDC